MACIDDAMYKHLTKHLLLLLLLLLVSLTPEAKELTLPATGLPLGI